MKLREVKWLDHPILGNLKLNFVDSSGNPYKSILFAGENGCGKTTVLQSLNEFLTGGKIEYFEYIEYEISGNVLKAIPMQTPQNLGFYDIYDGTNRYHIQSDRNNKRPEHDNNPQNIRIDGSVLSKARSDFNTNPIKNSSISKLDEEKYDADVKEDFTSLKQLLVDVENQDNSEYAELNKSLGNIPQSWQEFYPNSKLYRFKNAFNNFFDSLKYYKVEDRDSEKSILFKKNGIEINIDQLSTGEKQIVFRGSFLLKNSGVLNKATIFIDEPELSMHPKWQRKILKYYSELFSDASENIECQLFFATHSEHVLTSALKDKVFNLVIVMKDYSGVIKSNKIDAPKILPTITSAETNYLAFDIVSNDYHIELYGWLQEKTNTPRVKECDNYITSQPEYITSVHRKPSNHRVTTYDSICTYIRNAIHHPDNGNSFTEEELRTSIELLIQLCQ